MKIYDDINEAFDKADDDEFSISLYSMLEKKSNYTLELLNPSQKKIFLCMLLENFGQADSILAFLQEYYSEYNEQVVEALKEIGAVKSAEIIQKAVDLLPENNEWFFDNADEESIELMDKLDCDFSNYPDGLMSKLYREYAEKNKDEICKFE